MRDITIEKNDAGQRLDRFLKKYLANAPLSAIYKIIRKDVKLNGRRAKEDCMLEEGDVLSLYLPDSEIDAYTRRKKTVTAKKQFTVLYEDDDMLVVSKPYGLLVHGDKTEKKDTLTNQVLSYLIEKKEYVPRLEKSFSPSPVHRLDRNTTGIVVFAKNAQSLRRLSALFKEDGGVIKYYYALVHGKMIKEYHLKNKLVRDEKRNKGRVLPLDSPDGKYIETIARPIGGNKDFTLVEVELITGRTHQIRAHLSYAGFPLAGDTKYGGKAVKGLSTQLLHAAKLKIGDQTVEAPLPAFWADVQKDIFGKEILK